MNDTTAPAETVAFEHQGVTWHIPAALVRLQRDWDAANADCERLADTDERDAYLAATRTRSELTDRLYRDAWLQEHLRAGRRNKADLAVKACARAAG